MNTHKTLKQEEKTAKGQTELQPDDWLCLKCNKRITEDKGGFYLIVKASFNSKILMDIFLIL